MTHHRGCWRCRRPGRGRRSGSKFVFVHFAVVCESVWRGSVLVFRKVSPRALCAAAVIAAMWSQRVVGLQGSGSLRPGLSQLSEVRLSLWRYVCFCWYRVLLDWHRHWRGHSQDGILRVTVSVLFCSGGTVVFFSSAAHVVFRGYSVARPPLLEARALVVV